MVAKTELQELIVELKAAQERARIMNQISNSLHTTRDQNELLQVLAWLIFAATVNCRRDSNPWTRRDIC